MIAMIMCAGEGTRLRPLTYDLAKPMVPVANRPVLEYTLNNLRKNGIREVVINLSYKSEQIQSYFKDGSKWGMKIHYSVEKKLMGTAGGVKKVENIFLGDSDPDFLVTSGDGLTDVSFSKIIAYHKKKKSAGTIALKSVDSRFEYGVVLRNADGRIKRFVEKPCWGDIFSNQINTGIYVFSKQMFRLIPKNKFYDFGNQLWPRLLQMKKPIYALEFKDYWTDIGNVKEYYRAQKAVLDKEVNFAIDAQEIRPKVWVGKGTQIEKGAKLIAPCLIGNDCFVGKNATISDYAVINDGSRIGSGSVIKNSILWNSVVAADNARVENCVIGNHGKVSGKLSLYEGVILNLGNEEQI